MQLRNYARFFTETTDYSLHHDVRTGQDTQPSNQGAKRRQYYSGAKILKNEMGGANSTYGEKRGAYRVLVRRSEGKRPLRRPSCRWEDNITMDLLEMGLGTLTRLIWFRIGTGGWRS